MPDKLLKHLFCLNQCQNSLKIEAPTSKNSLFPTRKDLALSIKPKLASKIDSYGKISKSVQNKFAGNPG